MLEKRGTLKAVMGMSVRETKWGITGAQGWAWFAFAIGHRASLFGGGLTLTDGYVAQELRKKKRK